jgi:methionine-rich copper-binding protein CopC
MKKLVLPLILTLVAIVGIVISASPYGSSNQNTPAASSTPSDGSVTIDTSDSQNGEFIFSTPKKTAHYVSNTPEHGAILTSVPKEVQITFNFDLGVNSNIAVTREGKDYSSGNTIVSGDRLTLSKTLQSDMPNGQYTVSYTACWPDGSCYDGNFQFAVNR